MNEQLSSLIKLQEFDTALDALRKRGEALLVEKERLNQDIQNLKTNLEASKSSITQLQLKKKQLEIDIDGKDQQLRKFQGDLNSVKTNDAYKALLKEIEQAKTAKNASEDELLVILQSLEDAQKEMKTREQTHKADEQTVQAQIAGIDKTIQDLNSQSQSKKELRDSFSAGVTAGVRTRYETLSKIKGASVIVPILGDTCGGCRQQLPLHIINDVRKNQELVACNICSRILFFQQPDPSAKPAVSQPI